MELRHLRSFKTVAEELHFSRAAAKLHVAQPALSRTIADLEEEMAVTLLDRNSRGVKLTEAGELFLGTVRRILNETETAVSAAQRRSRGETGSLKIGFIGTLSLSLLPRLVRAYRAQFPDVELVLRELGPTQQREQILNGELDCGFLGLTSTRYDAELQTIVAASDMLMVAMSADHPLAKRSSISLKELRNERFYLTSRENAPVYNPWIIGLCQKAGFEPDVVLEIDRAATVLNYIAAGFGVSIFPAQVAHFAVPGVIFKPIGGRVPLYHYGLAWRASSPNRALAEFVALAKKTK